MDIMMSLADTFFVAELDVKKNQWWKVKTRDNLTGKEFHTYINPLHLPYLLALMTHDDFPCPPEIYKEFDNMAFVGAEGGCRPIP